MGKSTVEGSLRLDAHFWGQEGMLRLVPKLAFSLAESRKKRAGGSQLSGSDLIGLREMRWTRGTTPAGNIKWGVLDQSGGRAERLLLLFQITSYGTAHPRQQTVELDWLTPAGKSLRLPVLICPFCGRRCRFLCSAYPGRHGGPYLGEFACRQCAGLCYAQQLEYQSASARNFRAILNLSTKMKLHPERVTSVDFDKMDSLTVNPFGRNSRVEKLLTRLEGRSEERKTAFDLEKLEKPREWDLLPPLMFSPPKRRGRPNIKKQRQQARACARLVREADRQAQMKRPAGRPKARREYDTAERKSIGVGGQLQPEEGYCVGCRAGRRIEGAEPFTASNGRPGIKGKCADCGRGLCRMGSKMSAEFELSTRKVQAEI